jgi:hypothetical protein
MTRLRKMIRLRVGMRDAARKRDAQKYDRQLGRYREGRLFMQHHRLEVVEVLVRCRRQQMDGALAGA